MKATHHEVSPGSLALRPLTACLLAALATLDGGISASAQTPDALPSRPAATLPVASCADDGSAGTLRSVVAGAVSGDTVDLSQLDCGTITLQAGQIEVTVDNLTLAGPGRDALTIDAHDTSRVLMHSGTGTLTVSSLTLTHGRADAAIPSNPASREMRGGCVMSNGLTMTDVTVTECTAVNATGGGNGAVGGGIYSVGPFNLTNVVVSNNTATGVAPSGGSVSGMSGGVFASIGPITVTNSTITGNRALTGGSVPSTYAAYCGAFEGNGNTTITGSVIEGNFAGCDTTTSSCVGAMGGAVCAWGYDAVLNITSSTVSNNTVSASGTALGGGVVVLAGVYKNHKVTDTLLSNNQALSTTGLARGGGSYFTYGSSTISRSTISGNGADIGGGVFAYYHSLEFANSTVSSNSAGNAGGIYNAHASGYYGGNGPINMRNTTITANVATASSATGGVGGGIVDTQSNFTSFLQSNIVAGNMTPNADPAKADLIAFHGSINGANNLIVAATGVTLPSDTINAGPLLGPLQDNGGPTLTHALLPGSPAIDAGNNSLNLAFDQRGTGYARVVGAAADIGAFETQQLYVLPTLAKAFAPDSIGKYGTSTLTITLTNDNDISGVLIADLVDALPAPVVVADPANASTTCDSSVTADPGSASVTLGASAGFPAEGQCTITVSVTSGTAGTFTNTIPAGALKTDLGNNDSAATANLTVVNMPPAAAADQYTAAENSVLTVAAPGVLANDSDADGDPLTALLAVGPTHGTLALNPDGSFVYTPAAGFFGTDTFTYLANDGQASTAATVTITVKQVDQPPVAADDSYTTAEGTALTVDAPGVLANDSDPDGDTLTAVLVGNPGHGTLALNPNGSFVYTPDTGFFGPDTFTYKANDGQLGSGAATVTITVKQGTDDTIFADGFDER